MSPFYTAVSTSAASSRPSITTDQIELIGRIVPSVSWSTEAKLRKAGAWTEWHDTCAELHCVQDADRLDAIGAVGIMRCSAFSGAKGRILLDEGDGKGSAEGHFDEKLLKIRDRMKVRRYT